MFFRIGSFLSNKSILSNSGSHKIPVITDYQPGIYLQGEQDEEERKRMSTQYMGPSADWTANSSSLSHIFVPTSNTGDSCYVNQNDCKHSGNFIKIWMIFRLISNISYLIQIKILLYCYPIYRVSVKMCCVSNHSSRRMHSIT